VALAFVGCGGPGAASGAGDAFAPSGDGAAPSLARTPEEPLRGSVMGRVSTERVPTELVSRARVQVFDRYPVGATALDSLRVEVQYRQDGRFAVDLPPGRYWIGARLGAFSALRGPITVDSQGGPQDLVLAPDFVAFDVVTRRTPRGPELAWANAMAVHPVSHAPVVRAAVTLEDGAHRWPMRLARTGSGLAYHLEFADGGPIVTGQRLTVTLRSPELDDVPAVRTIHLDLLSDGVRPLDAPTADATLPVAPPPIVPGQEVRWYAPDDASYSLVCVLADAGTLLLDGCDEAVTSPYWLDTSRLRSGHSYELLVSAGRAVANGDGTAFNVDGYRLPLLVP
jgi:hypothetical protein